MAGVVISVALLWWALRGVNPTDILTHVRAARPLPLIAAVLLGTLTFPIRWIRWRILLGPAGALPQHRAPLWHAIAVGFMANHEDHHPDIEAGYGHCQLLWSTHDVGGLSLNDFICAARVEALLER